MATEQGTTHTAEALRNLDPGWGWTVALRGGGPSPDSDRSPQLDWPAQFQLGQGPWQKIWSDLTRGWYQTSAKNALCWEGHSTLVPLDASIRRPSVPGAIKWVINPSRTNLSSRYGSEEQFKNLMDLLEMLRCVGNWLDPSPWQAQSGWWIARHPFSFQTPRN